MSERKKEIHAKIARMILVRRLRKIGLVLLVLIPILLLTLWLGDVSQESQEIISQQEVTGVLVRLHQPQAEVPQPPFFVVELDTGEIVQIGTLGPEAFKKGARVRLMEKQTSARKRYSFIGYLDGE